ncbi:hypothetical protein HELRODRAFT_162334 [Helobdella robusta]|uniref:Uncharacterized protein n=1 Tax=Helobdella robusta TaxID=6412 RepID=T1ESI7_HELRO|nr:hypothetical protein HELRODRAFT_162334 [Helobdella robusta]ESN98872.1 hypothetical protein HELRODRAFT_162334 [Helobdella robusta]
MADFSKIIATFEQNPLEFKPQLASKKGTSSNISSSNNNPNYPPAIPQKKRMLLNETQGVSKTANSVNNQLNRFGHPMSPGKEIEPQTNIQDCRVLPNIVNVNGKTYKKIDFNKNLYIRQILPKKPFMIPANVDLSRFKSLKNTSISNDKTIKTVEQFRYSEDLEEYYTDIK